MDEKTTIRQLVEAHPEILDAHSFIIVSKQGNDTRLSVAGTGFDVLDMLDKAVSQLMTDVECPGCPNCQNGMKH